jgi:pimeloyl-ACP methyl ester carboxylesterase
MLRPDYGDNVVDDPSIDVGSAVLVHGLWGWPEDWRWVRQVLEQSGLHVSTPDLPSHRTSTAGLSEDAAEVRGAIRSCPGPVIAVGWSYGGSVISLAAAGERSVSHLVYLADIPKPAGSPGEDTGWIDTDPHILVDAEGRFALDNEWWLNEGDGLSFPAALQEHFRAHPRRFVTRATLGPQADAAWKTIPATVVIGQDDQLLSEDDRQWAQAHFDDFRVLDSDHFLIFRRPELVGRTILENA